MVYNTKQLNPHITYNHKPVEIVDSYKYVGLLFSSNYGILRGHLPYAEKCATRATFAVKLRLQPLKQTPPPIALKLFDSLVLPILEYGAEIWLPSTSHDILEGLHLRFLKTTLGVRPQTPTAAVYGDLGRFPLNIRLNLCCIKYWLKLCNKDNTSIVKKVYNMLLTLHNMGLTKHNWVSGIFKILKQCNLLRLSDQNSFTRSEIKNALEIAKNHLKSEYVQCWLIEMQNKSKLRTYIQLKLDFTPETYLFICNENHCRALAQF